VELACEFTVLDRQLDAPRGPIGGGKLVLSRLSPGSSAIGAPSPSLKLVLEGDERYEIDGRTIAVRPGEFLYLDAGSACIGTNRTAMTGICLLLPHRAQAQGGAHGHDPLLGRALVLSTRASAMGRTLEDYGRRIANDPGLGPLLADALVASVEYAIAEPRPSSRPGGSSTGGSSGRAASSTKMTAAMSRWAKWRRSQASRNSTSPAISRTRSARRRLPTTARSGSSGRLRCWRRAARSGRRRRRPAIRTRSR